MGVNGFVQSYNSQRLVQKDIVTMRYIINAL